MNVNDLIPLANTAAGANLADFSYFKIDDELRARLCSIGSFSCDKVWYGGCPMAATSGQIDGYRWLFGCYGPIWIFQVFKSNDAAQVNWDNYSRLSSLSSWEMTGKTPPASDDGLMPHHEIFDYLVAGIEKFRAEKPFRRLS